MYDNIMSLNRAYIDLDRLKENYELISKLAPGSELMCVVKANAYGHGIIECAHALYDVGCRYFAVSQLSEAMELREYGGMDCGIFILGNTPTEYATYLIDYDITQTIYSLEYARSLNRHFMGKGRVKAHIKLDTGMNRFGFRADEQGLAEAVEAAKLPCFDIEGCFTHFACADDPKNPMTEAQKAKFDSAVDYLKAAGVNIPIRHVCASSGIVNFPSAHYEMVRPGVILYGMQPSDTMKNIRDLKIMPVLSLESHISNLHTVKAGESVSYGATYTPDKDILVATLPIGYGDGFIRAYSGMTVEIGGEKRPIIGRICMDQCMVDATGLDVKLYDRVGIITDENPVEAFAKHANTITYECTCILNDRVPKSFIGEIL